MIYKQQVEVPSYLCDVDDRLHVWAAVRLCQEVTEYHGNATGIGFKTLLAQNRAWVITHALYHFHRLPMAFEHIMLNTWSRGNNGLIANRDYRVLSEAGETLVTGTSAWALIDMTSRRVMRLNDVISNYENHTECATEYDKLAKLQVPAMSDSDLAMQRPVSYAMLDHTRHVNNSEYIRMIFDCLHDTGFSTAQPFTLEINFAHESRPGDTLNLYRVVDGDTQFVTITHARGIGISAKITPYK